MLVIRHVEELNAKQLHALVQRPAGGARRAAGQRLRVAVTLNRKNANVDLTKLLRFFPATVELPPLRHHIEDLQELVPFFLAQAEPARAGGLLARGHAVAAPVELAR